MTTTTAAPLLEVHGVKKYYPVSRFGGLGGKVGEVKAVDGVTFTVNEGQTYGLVGESGSGKTTLGKVILRLESPTAGTMTLAGIDLSRLGRGDRRRVAVALQAVFQDPYSSLSPRMRVRDIVGEPLVVNKFLSKDGIKERVAESLHQVGLPESAASRFPHEFSGGQRQRIAIARAIASRPRLIVLDEPVSALDVSIRAQILNLLKDLQQQLGLSYLLIAHDLAIVEHMADTIGVMYLGRVVEQANGSEIFNRPLHPYTQALLAAVPIPDPARTRREFIAVTGEIPSAMHIPTGCRFHPRCPFATDLCATEEPAARELGPGHLVACHYAEKFDGPLPMLAKTTEAEAATTEAASASDERSAEAGGP